MRIVLFGPPGAGKGTQAPRLAKAFKLKHISTGELIREAVRADTPLGRESKLYIDDGKLAPTPLVNRLAYEAIRDAGQDGFILDGYPRTIEQADWLTDLLEESFEPLDAVVSLKVDVEAVVKRLSRRRVHVKTGENFHLDFNPPPPELDPSEIYQRDDDHPDAIRRRLQIYDQQTAPVEDYYRVRGKLLEVDGEGSIDDVFNRIGDALRADA